MADDPTQTGTQEPDKADATPAEAQKPDTSDAEIMIPKARFDEVNQALKKIQADMAATEEATKKTETERLEKQQEFQTLYEQSQERVAELEPFQKQWNDHSKLTGERNAERIEKWPEAQRSLVPDYDDPLKTARWLDENEPLVLAKPTAPTLNGGAGSKSRTGTEPTITDAAMQEQAVGLGVDPKLYKEALEQGV